MPISLTHLAVAAGRRGGDLYRGIDTFAQNRLGRPSPSERTANRKLSFTLGVDAAIDTAPWLIGGGGYVKGGILVRSGMREIRRQVGTRTFFRSWTPVTATKYVNTGKMIPHLQTVSRGYAMQQRSTLYTLFGGLDQYLEYLGEDLIGYP